MKDHQTLMNEAYDKWQAEKKMSYNDFVAMLPRSQQFAVLLGNLNYQVCNGGWEQWVDNGYCTQIKRLMDVVKLMKTDLSKKVLDMLDIVAGTLKDEVIAGTYSGDAWGEYYKSDDDDDCGSWFDDDEEVYGEEKEGPSFDNECTLYFSIEEAFMKECETFLQKIQQEDLDALRA